METLFGTLLFTVAIVLAIVAVLMIVVPIYNVWASEKSGQADLAKARYEQQIQIAQANGRLQAAEMNKQAAIIEAEAVAAQIATIGTGLQQHDLYLRWQWIKMMEDSGAFRETIYVPTEANLPILEAGRIPKQGCP
jgi:hypothetical protein